MQAPKNHNNGSTAGCFTVGGKIFLLGRKNVEQSIDTWMGCYKAQAFNGLSTFSILFDRLVKSTIILFDRLVKSTISLVIR